MGLWKKYELAPLLALLYVPKITDPPDPLELVPNTLCFSS